MQAAEMFKTLNPFSAAQPPQGPPAAQQPGLPPHQQLQLPLGGGRGRPASARSSPRPGSAQGLGPPPPGFGPTTAAAMGAAGSSSMPPGGSREGNWPRPDSAGGRNSSGGGAGRGRGRGRGRPTNSRPSAAYTTAPGRMQKAGMFISEQLRAELQQRSYLIQVSRGWC